MRHVKVTWKDITNQSGWHSLNQLEKFVADTEENIVYQVGYLYEEDGENIVLVDSYFEGETMYGAVTKIPKGCVVRIEDCVETTNADESANDE